MADIHTPLLQELSHAADSHDTNDQLSVLFRREVDEDSQKVQEYRRLSGELRETVRMMDLYINELQMSNICDEILGSRGGDSDEYASKEHFHCEAEGTKGAGGFANEVENPIIHPNLQLWVEVIDVFKTHVVLHVYTSRSSRIQQNADGVRSKRDFPIHFLYTLALIVLLCEPGVSCAIVESSIEVVDLKKIELEL
ncbi:hypothetical protein Tco_0523742 [Tanacetum coccineum]